MPFSLNPFAITLMVSGLLVGVLSGYIFFKVKGSTRWIALTMFCAAIWGFFYGLELGMSQLNQMMTFIKLEYIGISYVSAFWLIFTLKYTGIKFKNEELILFLILLIPTFTFFLVLTNEMHYLHYERMQVSYSGPFPTLKLQVGPWYFVHMIYSYLSFALGNIILWKRFRFADQLYRTQTNLIIVAGLFPLIFNVLYQSKLFIPFETIDLTPYAFLLTYLVIGFAIIKYNLFSIKPIALTKIMEAITKGVLVLDVNHMVVDFNPAFQNFFLKSKKVKTGLNVDELFAAKPELLKLLHDQQAKTVELADRESQNTKYFSVELIPLLDKKDQSYGSILMFEDITNQKQINEKLSNQASELLKLNNLKDKYFSIISHDLKGPITSIKDLLHYTDTGLISQEEFMELLPEVSKNMEDVTMLLENLLAWTSSQIRGGEHMQLKEFTLNEVIEQQIELLQRVADGKNIQIESACQTELKVKADKNMMELVLRNLMNNALKFSTSGSKILVRTSEENGMAKTCIQDFGKGISPENLARIKEGVSFTTLGENQEKGTGLGLILTKEYIEKNRGQLDIESVPGKGSTFCISLPKS
ncbi:ATP-binding protein [Algoriphagus halophytocola]|uniref:histidine kinase n=1 Tax=Algoriphagus halophytocola TaxID=2991499 RepID=A0ABY6MJS0_9BACT|nr:MULTISPECIES: histidine kinase N-terminal 7TM domain-containing protein [unclassified Algoriphagus]UZD24027.1 ATP-binding protein [Algoriphagus sp. TR-M5]WBL41399.1 ATP-binding protein [Algoriphagus sp. TR-M9]